MLTKDILSFRKLKSKQKQIKTCTRDTSSSTSCIQRIKTLRKDLL